MLAKRSRKTRAYQTDCIRFPRRYTNHAEPIIAAVPSPSFASNNQTFAISAVGATEHTRASTVTAHPDIALKRLPAFHALPKI